jgi:orotidine-5'-phosphate decarboxylase
MAAVAELIRPDTTDSSNRSNMIGEARGKLIVALDFDTVKEAEALVDKLGDEAEFYKVGLGLQLAGGETFVRTLKSLNKRVFLDYKYYDIGETIRRAVARAADFDVDFLTVHGVSGILQSAVAGRGDSKLKIFCVTVLTSMDVEDIREMGFPPQMTVDDLVVHRAKKAFKAGVDGVIASAREVEKIRNAVDGALMIVTPGIRSEGHDHDDQKRTATAFDAVKAGADYLVIGRPITKAADPVREAKAIIGEMARALS